MEKECGVEPDALEEEAVPSLDERLQPAFLAAMRRTEADVAALSRLASSLPNGFPRTRYAVGTRLLAAGGARRDVEPMLASDLGDVPALLRCLEDVTPPPWLGEHVVEAYRRWVPHASDGGMVFDAAVQLLAQDIQPATEPPAILEEAMASLQRLGVHDRSDVLLELTEAIRTECLPDVPGPLLVRTVVTTVLAAAPDLARRLLSGTSPADLEAHLAAMLGAAARSDVAWLPDAVAGAITASNAAEVLEAWLALDETAAEQLRVVAERAVGVVPLDAQDRVPWTAVAHRDPALALVVHRRSPQHVVDRVVRGLDARYPVDPRTTAFLVELHKADPVAFERAIGVGFLRGNGLDTRTLEVVVRALRSTADGVAMAGRVLDVAAEALVAMRRIRPIVTLGIHLAEFAAIAPAHALRCVHELEYAGVFIEKILAAVLRAPNPPLSELEIFRHRFVPRLSSSLRERVLAQLAAPLPAPEALDVARREGIRPVLVVEALVSHRTPSPEEAEVLLAAIENPARRLELLAKILDCAEMRGRADDARLRTEALALLAASDLRLDTFGLRASFGEGYDLGTDRIDMFATLVALEPEAVERHLHEVREVLDEAGRTAMVAWTARLRERAIPRLLQRDPTWLMEHWDVWKDGLGFVTHDLVEAFLAAMPPPRVLDAFLELPEPDVETLRVSTVLEHARVGAETRRCLASLLARLGRPGADPMGTLEVGLRFAQRGGMRPFAFLTDFAQHLNVTEA